MPRHRRLRPLRLGPYSIFFNYYFDHLPTDRLQMGEVVSRIPTIGFNVETVQYNNIKFQVWDLGGQTSIRYLFLSYVFSRKHPNTFGTGPWWCN
ncbi:hypothetical protein V6Z11_A05G251700 [Gossypium hirsutum]|uniref:ADP-ribosylation factor 1 isoform X2 n=2 Tax=Gossypium TaxID=3633 RepID=A0ABM3BSH0_GOSHI|nr:ADP-ribosylation factor 1-like isoform X2 [Gossypium hirsutum]TYI28616.1 hypothetical protein ES332_A05G256700v1 [Gossypium tomentosum]